MSKTALLLMCMTAKTPAWIGSVTTRSACSGTLPAILRAITGKMSELQAALGLAQLDSVTQNTEKRKCLAKLYRKLLDQEPGLVLLEIPPDVDHNYAYFPIRVRKEKFGLDRDRLYSLLKDFNIYCRKYFYPLCSSHPWCRVGEGALPHAETAAREVLCLPIYATLPETWVEKIATAISGLGRLARRCVL